MELNLPNFLIVGVARCGTTSLYHYLIQHPEIGFSKIKEPKYFSSLNINFPQKGISDHTVDEKIIKSIEEYKKLFSGKENFKRIGEASSDYFFYHKDVISEIKKTIGDTPIIISIRNPIERTISAYNNLVRDGRENLSIEEAINQEKERVESGWDWMWAYTGGSMYSEGIQAFQKHFSKVKIVLFEDLENPNELLNEISEFLGVSNYDSFDTDVKYSPSGKPKNLIIKIISSRNITIINTLRRIVIENIPRNFLERISKGFFKKEDVNVNIKKQLLKIFEEDINKTEKLIHRDLSSWKK